MDSSKTSEANDWQGDKTARECHEYMFEMQLACDVTFKLKSQNKVIGKLGAHKFVLMARSPVFFAMFEGPMKETSDEIVISDIEGEPFRQFLRYLYLDEVHLSDATCMGIMYAAKKYMVKSLRDKCAAYLQKHIQIQTVWSVLEHSLHLDEPELVNCALEFVDENAEECLGSRQFTQISHGTLCKVLERDTLHVEEVLVFRACLEWAGVRCLDEGVPVSVDRIRKDLGKALYLIRFPLMEISDFSNTVVSEGLLSDKEVISVFLALTREKTPADLKFSDVEREGASGTTVWVTGVARAATTLSAKAFESGRLYHNLSGKYIRLRSVFFALHSREVLRKLKTVKVLATETNVTYQTQVFRETKLPKNDFVNVKAVFKEKVMLLAGNYFVFTLEFDSALKPAEVVYFSGSPVMAIKGQNCSFNSSAFFHFVGITFEE